MDLRRGYSSKKVAVVKKIVNDVEKYGDKSLIKYEKKFNNLKTLKSNNLTFTKSEIKKRAASLIPTWKKRINEEKEIFTNLIND